MLNNVWESSKAAAVKTYEVSKDITVKTYSFTKDLVVQAVTVPYNYAKGLFIKDEQNSDENKED